jgi:hypothetical protein
MWRRLFKPEVLFFFGAAQSLFPYLLWKINGPFPLYIYTISYIPLFLWIAGYTAFWLGAKCAGLHAYPRPRRNLVTGLALHRPLMIVVVIALVVQIAALSRVYGGIPILQYLSGHLVADQTEELTYSNAFSGQLGLLLNSQMILDGLIIILLVSMASRQPRRRLLLIAGVLTALAAGLSTGKRQTVAILMVMIACSSSIYFGHPLRPLLHYMGLRRSKWLARVLLIVLPIAFVAFLGLMVRLRTGADVTGGGQVLATWHIGLINLETQAAAAGYGPYRFDLLRLTQYMVPDRIFRRLSFYADDRPPRAEATASAGFYGDLHWSTGLPGVILFSFFIGWLAKYFYFRARTSLFHLMAYSLMCWTLIAAHSYNHFLHLNFLLLPMLYFWILARYARSSRPRVRTLAEAGSRAGARPQSASVHLRFDSSTNRYVPR